MEKILIIGNGFDLAHKLPTTYRDFLDFCRLYSDFTENKESVSKISETEFNKLAEHKQNAGELNSVNRHLMNALKIILTGTAHKMNTAFSNVETEFRQLIQNNCWLAYFEYKKEQLGGNWIDFETEISKVLHSFQSAVQNIAESPGPYARFGSDYPDPYFLFKYYFPEDMNEADLFAAFPNWLCEDKAPRFINEELTAHLDRLIRALEIYLSVIVANIRPEKVRMQLPEITQNSFDYVLSFNYTDTFRRFYPHANIRFCFIHGKAEAGHNRQTCDLVLGIHDHPQEEGPQEFTDAVLPFKKFYQRIYKGTDDDYLDWLDYIHAMKDRQFELHIFGHSLDITDKEVLSAFLLNDNVRTKIYYYRKSENDKTEMGRQIRNLIRIIGAEELIRKTGGSGRTIEFIPLKPQES